MLIESRQMWNYRILWLLGLLLNTLLLSRAEQLPVRTYTTADGLPRDAVTHIEQDSGGFIWLIAGDGLSRFDGYRFINYTTTDGLPDRRVNDLLETRAGVYWIATDAGLCRLNPTGDRSGRNSASPMFAVYNPDGNQRAIAFNILAEDDVGAIWCGTSEGLYRLDVSASGDGQLRPVDLGMARASSAERNVLALLKDRRGFLWVGTESGALYRLAPEGRIEHYTNRQGLPQPSPITSLLETQDGTIWVGTHSGLCRLVAEPDSARPIVSRIYLKKDGLASAWIMSLYETRDGKLWVATSAGLSVYLPATDAQEGSFRVSDIQNGTCDQEIWDVTEDRDDNLWMASRCGAMKVLRNGFTGYGLTDGLAASIINSIFEDRDGTLFVVNSADTRRQPGDTGRIINRFDGARFTSVDPNLPAGIAYHGWGWGQTITQDHLGQWWIPTGEGLYRFPKVARLAELARSQPEQIHAPADGFDKIEIFRLYEDSHGDMWIATTGRDRLWRWERATDSFHDYTAETGAPPNTDFTFFAEDHAGNLWIGTSESLLRYSGGKFKRFTVSDGVPPGWIIWLYTDHAGRLWLGSQLGGLNRIDDPTASAPSLQRYTTADGLSSNNIRSITEDEWGRIYLGTGHGVDRLDPETRAVKHFTVADGLPKGTIEQAYRDHQGALWFGSYFGVSRFTPQRQESRTPPNIYLTGLRIEGVARRVSELGEVELPQMELAADQKQVSIEFVGLGASPGAELRYQYRLEGAESKWSAPTDERTINYANLAPGTYRFMVRAVSADGSVSPAPATFNFTILAPIWQRWWFWATIALSVCLAALLLYRYRIARLLEVANMRTRIATDLHDDIGANLTRIAILSEVACQQTGKGEDSINSPLSSIARISRESVAAMSDIVWAINPERDQLLDLVRRMRQHAEEVFTSRDILLRFEAPAAAQNLKLSVDVRRDLFLIFKEAVNNAARHANAARVRVDLYLEGLSLVLEVSDDGVGFDTAAESEGHGLMSMRRRAENLGGTLVIESRAGQGTTLRLKIPLSRPRSFG